MSRDKTGGPAFPVIGAPGATEDYPGMTLRDYFAAKAIQQFCATEHKYTDVAIKAYRLADAMLRERDK